MATHTGGENYKGRKFTINRENGQTAKDGYPHFFEWIKELPATPEKGRKFETRQGANGVRHYELFRAIDGYLSDIRVEEKKFGETKPAENWLVVELADDEDTYIIEIGEITSRWASDTMKRLLHDAFDPEKKLRLAPYSSENLIGVSVFNGVDKLTAQREDAHLQGIFEPTKREWKGKTEYDWTPVSTWLWAQVNAKVKPRLFGASAAPVQPAHAETPIQTNVRASAAASAFPTTAQTAPRVEPPAGDDLPF